MSKVQIGYECKNSINAIIFIYNTQWTQETTWRVSTVNLLQNSIKQHNKVVYK